MKRLSLYIALFLLLVGASVFFYQRTHKELLIIGCARSGTKFISTSLRGEGMRIAHERIGGHGLSSWDLTAGPDVGRWKTRRGDYHFKHVFHQVRHPLSVISSVYVTEDQDSWNYILTHTPEIDPRDPLLVKCAKYWYYWNLKAEKLAEWRYSVEKIDAVWEEYGRRLGRKFHKATLTQIPKDTQHSFTKGIPHQEFTWEDLQEGLDPELFENIVSLAQKYGYSKP